MGFKIFGHALRLVFDNMGAAFRISGVLYLLAAGFSTIIVLALPSPATAWPLILVANLVSALLLVWVATAWHRFVLLDEMPDSLLPTFDGGRILRYVGTSLLLGLVGLVITIPVGIVLVILGALKLAPLVILGAIAFYVALLIAGYRISVILPASSVERPLKLGQAWEATRGASGTIVVLAIVTFICAVILQLPTFVLLAVHVFWVAQIWSFVTGWVALMVGVAVITTLYGHYVEGRAIA